MATKLIGVATTSNLNLIF